MTVLVPLAEGFEELEAITLSDILRRAGLSVYLAGLSTELLPIGGSRGARVLPDLTLETALALGVKHYQAIILPGGQPGTDNLLNSEKLASFLKTFWQDLSQTENRYLGALCAAPKVLAAAGLLHGKRISVFPGALANLPESKEILITQAPVTIDGQLITGRGPGSALAFALIVAEKLAGRPAREAVEGNLW